MDAWAQLEAVLVPRYTVPRSRDVDTQRAFQQLVSQLETNSEAFPPFGVVLEDLALSTTVRVVNHGLGYKPRGWVVVDKDADARIYRSANKSATTISLTASATVTATVWVF